MQVTSQSVLTVLDGSTVNYSIQERTLKIKNGSNELWFTAP
jgi:hypothetical protein